jgi:hypothetical protein
MVTNSIKSRSQRFRDGLKAIRGTLICAVVLVFIDVVLDGSYLFSEITCPILLVVGAIRAIARRENVGVVAARLLIPVVTLLLVVANYYLQTSIAMANAARVIEACEHYRQANGVYPERLGDLVPSYLSSVPIAKYCWLYSEFQYIGSVPQTLLWYDCPPYGRRIYLFERNEWHFVD